MTLIITGAAAIIATLLYICAPKLRRFNTGFLSLVLWGATLMWCVDDLFNLFEGEAYIDLVNPSVMADDAALGFCVVGLALVLWLVVCIYKSIRAKKRKTDCI
ncbi:MAG: hypothetical protein LUB61_03490 [Eggerthellaceae bacterium]|nr:hypothetical protein [Eggerthellaceae bacterium]